MVLKSEKGHSLIEIIIALAILLFVGGMVTKYFSRAHETNLQLEARDQSRQILNSNMNRIRHGLDTRDSSKAMVVQDTLLSYEVPISTTSGMTYRVTIQNKCRMLPTGESLTTRNSVYNLKNQSCLTKLKCGNGVPYTEWTYTSHPTLTLQKEPSDARFAVEIKKAYGIGGYGVCFEKTSTGLKMEGVLINLQKTASVRVADLATEIATIPLTKRNEIELVP